MARERSQSYLLNEPSKDPIEVARLFGCSCSQKSEQKAVPSRLQFYDCFLTKESIEALRETGITEIKFENSINRMSSIANPRQIERVVRGAVFEFSLIYDVIESSDIQDDFQNLAEGFRLLQMDYLGGHGTRGCGKVAFQKFSVKLITPCIEKEKVEQLTDLLREVESDGVLPL